MSNSYVSELLGERIRQYRLNQDLTQEQLAERANISVTAVKSAERGKSTLPTYVEILSVLGRLDSLLAAFPDDGVSPVQLLKSSTGQKQRASGKQSTDLSRDKELDW